MTTPAPILLTGFAPFGGLEVNPSQLLVESLADEPGVVAAVLPVSYAGAAEAFAAAVEAHQPMAALCFGLSRRTDFLLIERVAWNRDESEEPDADGVIRTDVPIIDDAPTAYGCSLPIPELLRAIAMAGAPVSFSDHAGGYVCNHLFYMARHYAESRGLYLPLAFIHVPPLPEQVAGQRGRRGMPLDHLIVAGRAMTGWLRRGLSLTA